MPSSEGRCQIASACLVTFSKRSLLRLQSVASNLVPEQEARGPPPDVQGMSELFRASPESDRRIVLG